MHERDDDATDMGMWLMDTAERLGLEMEPSLRCFTGEFRSDGVLVPTDGGGVRQLPAVFMDGAVRNFGDRFVIQHLYYTARHGRYAVVETA